MIALPSSVLAASLVLQQSPAAPHTRTTPASERSLRFAVIGDFGIDNADEAHVATLVHDLGPDIVITVGDDNYPDGSASTIDAHIGQYYHEFIAPYSGAYGAGATTNRFFPSLGNHDWLTAGAQPYLDYFQLPGNERYYQFARGDVRFFALDSDAAEPDGVTASSVQATWLKNALAAASEPIKVVYFHHPPYSSGAHGPNPELEWPFREWGASIVLCGHDHDYERIERGGFTYVVDGVGGAQRYPLTNPQVGTREWFGDDFGALYADVRGDVATFQFVTASGFVRDTFAVRGGFAGDGVVLVPARSTWRYDDSGTDRGTAWRATAFDDASWASGPAVLGYGNGGEGTVVSYGPDRHSRWITTYFRRAFDVADPAALANVVLELDADDGAVAYLNDVEIARQNLPAGPITAQTLAATGIGGADEHAFVAHEVPLAALHAGTNVLAVEVHQVLATSSDVEFDLRLSAERRGDVLVARGSTWRYRDGGQLPAPNWTSLAYDDSSWASGPAQLGYGEGDEATVLSYGSNPAVRPISSWFRRHFTVANASAIQRLALRLLADDGAVVFVNGVEILRRDLPIANLDATSPTQFDLAGADEQRWYETWLDPRVLHDGDNVVAVEVHQSSISSDDLSFDCELAAL